MIKESAVVSVGPTMTTPAKVPKAPSDEWDDEIALPPMSSVLDEEEELGVAGGFDVTSAISDALGAENVGLDDAAAEDLFDPAALLSFEETESALGDDAAGIEGDALGALADEGGEYGYTEGNEPIEGMDVGVLVHEPERITTDDGGAEGLAGLSSLRFNDDDSLQGLPALVAGAGDEEEVMEELDLGVTLTWGEEAQESVQAPLWPIPLHWSRREAVGAVVVGDEGLLLGGEGLHRRAGEEWVPVNAEVQPEGVVSIASSSGALYVGTRRDGVFCSKDDCTTFVPDNSWASGRGGLTDCEVLADATGRIWLRTAGSAYRLGDNGRWLGPLLPMPIADLVAHEEGVAAVSAGPEPTLFVSADGVRWARRKLPLSEAASCLMFFGGRVVLGLEDGGVWMDSATGTVAGRILSMRPVQRLLVHDDSLYGVGHRSADDRLVILRYRRGEVVRLLDLPPERTEALPEAHGGIHEPLAATFEGEGQDAVLWLALGGGLARVACADVAEWEQEEA